MPASSTAFGKYLRTHRKAERYSQQALGKLLGVTHSYLSQVERGDRPPLAPEYWPALVKTLPGMSVAELQRAAALTRPLEIDLAKASPEQADLALALALRIRNRDLSGGELAALNEILGGGASGAPVRAHGRVVEAGGKPAAGRAFVYRLGKARGWSAVVGVRGHAGAATAPIDGRAATLVGKPVDLGAGGSFDVPGGLAPGDYALDLHHADGRELWAFPLTVSDGRAPQDVPVVCDVVPPPPPRSP